MHNLNHQAVLGNASMGDAHKAESYLDNVNPSESTRKRTKRGPPFNCEFPDCGKSFQRSEHLSRHKLNHNPKTIFKCSHVDCKRTFVRHDLLVRHLKRHENKIKKGKQRNDRSEFLSTVVANYIPEKENEPQLRPIDKDDSAQVQLSFKTDYRDEATNSAKNILQQHGNISNDNEDFGIADPAHTGILQWLFDEGPGASTEFQINTLPDLGELNANSGAQSFFISEGLNPFNTSPSSVLSSTPNAASNGTTPISTLPIDSETIHSLQSFQQSQGIQISVDYNIDESSIYALTSGKMKSFGNLIPELKKLPDFTLHKFQKALKTYWNFFHPRFPMLHRPTFNASLAPDLLILSMVILGSKLFMCVDNITCSDKERLLEPKRLADTITEPLRWLLFSSPQFQPPAEVWIIQSLLMLEFYEKHCTNRKLHERGHLHHGTTIQLLRRSPTLGGSPTKDNSNNDNSDNWYKWIEIESLKRATFMCFYMDATDAINFGHQMLIYAHQIQMTMPVEDAIWESKFSTFQIMYKQFPKSQQFLLVLKNLMNGKPMKTNSFGKKILLAGLSAILFQIQQRDIQLCFGLDKFSNTISNNWRDLLTAAFAIWRNDVGQSCCSSKTAIDNLNSLGNSSQFSTSDTRCKCITYHVAHVYMSVSHYDIFMVAGAPWRMNVKPASIKERNAIQNRVMEWSKSRHADVAVVQCYLILFEMFLSPQDNSYDYQYDYLPDADLFFRSYVIGYCVLVIWSYIQVKQEFNEPIDIENSCNKNGYEYLRVIRDEFTKASNIKLHNWHDNPSGSEFYGNLMKWVQVLNDIKMKKNIAGLLNLVGDNLRNADYSAVREVGKLILFCKDRITGVTDEIILEDMYE